MINVPVPLSLLTAYEDDKFLACALSASADYIVSGDKNLCDKHRYKSIKTIKASDFLKMFR